MPSIKIERRLRWSFNPDCYGKSRLAKRCYNHTGNLGIENHLVLKRVNRKQDHLTFYKILCLQQNTSIDILYSEYLLRNNEKSKNGI